VGRVIGTKYLYNNLKEYPSFENFRFVRRKIYSVSENLLQIKRIEKWGSVSKLRKNSSKQTLAFLGFVYFAIPSLNAEDVLETSHKKRTSFSSSPDVFFCETKRSYERKLEVFDKTINTRRRRGRRLRCFLIFARYI